MAPLEYFWEEEAVNYGWINLCGNGSVEPKYLVNSNIIPTSWEHSNMNTVTLRGTNFSRTYNWDECSRQWVSDEWLGGYLKCRKHPNLNCVKKRSLVAGIPVIKNYDLAIKCIDSLMAGTVYPELIYLIDNGQNYSAHARLYDCNIVVPQKNLGVAASWNLIHKLAPDADLLIVNDDVEVGPDTIENMRKCSQKVVASCNWSCFIQDKEVWDVVGPYDESFYPGNYEDVDYRRRLRMAGIEVAHIYDKSLKHAVSASADHSRSQLNHQYFCNKWRIS